MTDLKMPVPGTSVSIRHLRIFNSVAELNGVRRASQACHLSQPAVTQAIVKLEGELGVQLLVRSPTGTYLNNLGMIFHARTRRFFALFEEALQELGVPSNLAPLSRLAGRVTRSQLRSLMAIVDHGSFAQAARRLRVSQASLQRAARDLERTLSTPLYIQTASGIIAAPAAVEFARKLRVAQREIDLGIDELAAAQGSVGGEIVIGALLLAGSVVLASVINELTRTFPDADIRILNGNAEDILRNLNHGEVDLVIGLLQNPASSGLVHEVLAQTPYVVVGRHGHPLMSKSRISLADLAAYEWVIGTPGANRRTQFDSMFKGGARPLAPVTTCSLPIIRLLLSHSDRLTLLTSYELMYEEDALAAVPFGRIEPSPSIGLTMRENWLPTRLQGEITAFITRRVVESLNPLQELRRMGDDLAEQESRPDP
jgi:DNA-binding transcriptional LysR family regulator